MAGVILPVCNVPVYPTISQFPLSAQVNQLATAADTGDLYEFFDGAWELLSAPGVSGVTSLNTITGAITLVAGTGISVTPSGQNITIAATGGGGGITQLTGDVTAGPGSGSQAATVVSVGGQTAAAIAAATVAASASTFCGFTEDFLGYESAQNNDLFMGTQSGSGANTTPAGGSPLVDNAHPGIAQMSTGTTSGGGATIYTGLNFTGGGGPMNLEWLCYWPTLSGSGDTYDVIMGFCASFSINSPGFYGVYATYTDSVNSGNFVFNADGPSSASSSVNTSVAPIPGTWNKFNITINAAASQAVLYLNGTAIGTLTVTSQQFIPNTTSSAMNAYFSISKTAGTNSRALNIDYVQFKQTFTTPR